MIEILDDFIFFKASSTVGSRLNAVYSRATDKWRLPNTLGALRELHTLGYDVLEYGKQKTATRSRLLQEKLVPDSRADTRLRPYQQQDVNFFLQANHLANFSHMRTGKTPVMCQVLQFRNVRSIVVCPASLTYNWVQEIHEWSNLKATTVGKSTPKKRREIYKAFHGGKFDVLVISKDTARADLEHLLALDAELLLIDEAHFLRNYETRQSSAMFRLGQNMKYRYAITGTPASNTPDDVFGILKFLQPDKYPSYWQFVERYFNVSQSPFGMRVGKFKNINRKKEFWEIVEEISVQHKRKDVMAWLPDKQYQTIKLEMGKKQRKAYDEMLNFYAVEGTTLSAPSVLAQLTRLRQLSTAPEMLGLEVDSVKEDFILEWLQDNPKEQVVIFSNFSSYLKKLYEKLQDSAIIIGETPQNERQTIVQAFQAGHCNVLLANIQAAGTGLTLDRAGTVIFLDRAYNPDQNEQAEDRIVATTEQSEVQNTLIIDLVCTDSVDEKILRMVKNKQKITEIVNNYKNIKEFLK